VAEQRDFVIPVDLEGVRVDKAVATLFGISRSLARQVVENGVVVDGRPAGPGDRVKAGSVLSGPIPDSLPEMRAEPIPFDVLHEDEDVIVVDKPAGVVVHPGRGRLTGTLAAGLLHRYPELKGVGEPGRWGLVHRLDKDTSGVLVVARSRQAHQVLVTALGRRDFKRSYLALATGIMGSATGTIDAPIGRDPARPMRRAVRHDGKPARTHYRVLETFPASDCSLLGVELDSGRTHQIRVHLAGIGHPVVGDPTYGRGRSRVSVPRIFLHATHIEFDHPRSGARMSVDSELPGDLMGVLEALRSSG
jgi:23S rRNA pseudouridine1911/1915/1917 synthase